MANNALREEPSSGKFPTVSLKSLLQNSDLLEILLKPMSKSDDDSSDNKVETSNIILNPSPTSSASSFNELTADSLPLDLHNLADLPSFIVDDNKSNELLDWDNEYLKAKVDKLTGADSDAAAAKLYGNAFLGPNLWDKNDLFQGGVKFEHLEIDEFLNENGLNQNDVEFLDQIQKIDALNVPSNLSTIYTTNNNNSMSNSSPSTASTSSGSIIPVPVTSSSEDALSSVGSQDAPRFATAISPSQTSKLSPEVNNDGSVVFEKQSIGQGMSKTSKNQVSGKSSKSTHFSKQSQKEPILDWSSSSNDLSMSSMNDFDDLDPKTRKFSDEDLRPQPVLRKSKKQFVPNEMKDEKYWARRRKNNIAAKRSRDARRMKENQIAIRASYLERENDALRKQLEDFKRENKSLKVKITKYEAIHPELQHLDC